jgi:hypothetical protein
MAEEPSHFKQKRSLIGFDPLLEFLNDPRNCQEDEIQFLYVSA